jgi:hypothetical protein
MAAERLGVAVSEVRLVAAHAWDVAGATSAMRAAASRSARGSRTGQDVQPDPLAAGPRNDVLGDVLGIPAGTVDHGRRDPPGAFDPGGSDVLRLDADEWPAAGSSLRPIGVFTVSTRWKTKRSTRGSRRSRDAMPSM